MVVDKNVNKLDTKPFLCEISVRSFFIAYERSYFWWDAILCVCFREEKLIWINFDLYAMLTSNYTKCGRLKSDRMIY